MNRWLPKGQSRDFGRTWWWSQFHFLKKGLQRHPSLQEIVGYFPVGLRKVMLSKQDTKQLFGTKPHLQQIPAERCWCWHSEVSEENPVIITLGRQGLGNRPRRKARSFDFWPPLPWLSQNLLAGCVRCLIVFGAPRLNDALRFPNLSSKFCCLPLRTLLTPSAPWLPCSSAADSPSTSSKINMTSPRSALLLPSRMWLAAIKSRVEMKGKSLVSKGSGSVSLWSPVPPDNLTQKKRWLGRKEGQWRFRDTSHLPMVIEWGCLLTKGRKPCSLRFMTRV